MSGSAASSVVGARLVRDRGPARFPEVCGLAVAHKVRSYRYCVE